MATDAFLVTCEHGGNRLPAPYRLLFHEYDAMLASHRGYDPGALAMARSLAKCLGAQLVSSTISRLLVDLNRSIGHPQLFSEVTRGGLAAWRAKIIEKQYLPYRTRVEGLVRQAVSRGRRVVHISSHSFTPEFGGEVRRTDVGLLYDPGRRGEAKLCGKWKKSLEACAPEFRVRRNYPYLGKGDGLTSHLRRAFPGGVYLGIELEVNQGIVLAEGRRWDLLRKVLCDSLRRACV